MFLIHLKFSTVILMLQDSWRSGDHGNVSQYLTCLRYLIRLEAISNAPKYLHMNTHFLKWWECASTCLKKIFETYLFTKVSNNGELMPSDLCMEKHIGDVRYMYGKKCFINMAARLATEVPQLDEMMSRYDDGFQKQQNVEERVSYNERLYKLGEPYVKTYNFAQKLNLWGEGPPNIDNHEELVSPVTGEIISSSILDSWTESEKRVKDYCLGGKPSLKCFRTKSGQVQQDADYELKKQTSLDKADLENLMSKEEILNELRAISRWMRDEEYDFLEIRKLSSADSKGLLAEALVIARGYYFEDNPEAKEEREEICFTKELLETITSQQNRSDEIERGQFFYRLHPNATVLRG